MFSLPFLLIFLSFSPGDDLKAEADDPVEVVRRQLRDVNRPVEVRAAIALEAASVFDKRAERAENPSERTKLTITAINLLDEFNAANPKNPHEITVAIQAAVYLWADARRAIDDAKLTPKPIDEPIKKRARSELDAAIARFGRIEPALSGVDPLVAQNCRFRLAQAYVDRSTLDPPGSPEAKFALTSAWNALDPMPTETAISGYAYLLRADIRVKRGEFDSAEGDLDMAQKSKVPPPIEVLLDVKVAQLCGERRYTQAIEAIDAAKLDPITNAVLSIKARVAHRNGVSAGGERRDVDADVFRRAQVLRASERVDARLALIDLARGIENPSPHSEPEVFDTLADGVLALGDAVRASALLEHGADNAASAKNLSESTRLRLRAGAVLFQDGKYADADAIFSRMWADPKTGKDRPKAGMLRVLSRGRALAENVPGSTPAAYLEAMQALVTEHPDDPSTGEARWLLGQAEAENSRIEKALAHWNAIAPGQPRWLASRLAIAQNNERVLDDLRIANDQAAIKAAYQKASTLLRQSIAVVADSNESIDLKLALIRLNLRPEVAQADATLEMSAAIEQRGASEAQHLTNRALKIVALAETNKFPESEREARAWAAKLSDSDLRLACRLLDHASNDTENDANRSRYGRIVLRLLLEQPPKRKEEMSARLAAELNLRFVRGQIATGSTDSARKSFAGQSSPNVSLLDADGLRDLADAYIRIEAYGLAIDVERLRVRSLKPGTAAWVESRYGLALSLYRSKKSAEALRLIDATEVLHPELGGPTLKDKFIRLRQRIAPQ